MADKRNDSDRDQNTPGRDPDEQALGNEEIVGVSDDDDEFEDTDDLDDEEDEEGGTSL